MFGISPDPHVIDKLFKELILFLPEPLRLGEFLSNSDHNISGISFIHY
ncbi:hypothetical protein BACCOP_00896, partial [Phocaeicola coprocola DSM 17136]